MFKDRRIAGATALAALLTITTAVSAGAQAQGWPCWGGGPYAEGPRGDWGPSEEGWGPMMMMRPDMSHRAYGGGRFAMARFGEIDTDHDGVVSDEEAAGNVERTFYAMDADGNDMLTLDEFVAVRMGSGSGYDASRQAQQQERKQQRFGEMDQDQDDLVSRGEFLQAGQQRFEASDSDGDGQVTPWEFRASRPAG